MKNFPPDNQTSKQNHPHSWSICKCLALKWNSWLHCINFRCYTARVFLLPLRWDTSPLQKYLPALNSPLPIYIPGRVGEEGLLELSAQEYNSMSLARVWIWLQLGLLKNFMVVSALTMRSQCLATNFQDLDNLLIFGRTRLYNTCTYLCTSCDVPVHNFLINSL